MAQLRSTATRGVCAAHVRRRCACRARAREEEEEGVGSAEQEAAHSEGACELSSTAQGGLRGSSAERGL
eukprot:286356-Rhodomonas_salina.1